MASTIYTIHLDIYTDGDIAFICIFVVFQYHDDTVMIMIKSLLANLPESHTNKIILDSLVNSQYCCFRTFGSASSVTFRRSDYDLHWCAYYLCIRAMRTCWYGIRFVYIAYKWIYIEVNHRYVSRHVNICANLAGHKWHWKGLSFCVHNRPWFCACGW
jgi:hypothetical protein